MADKIELPVAGQQTRGIGRREILQGLAGSVGAGFALPALADGHPMQRHLEDHARVAAADAKAAAPGATPAFLDAHQVQTLGSLAEAIVPGSTAAKVAPFVDHLLAVDTQENQRAFLAALGAFEGQSIARYNAPWKELTDAQRTELLTVASTAAAADGTERHHWPRRSATPKQGATLRDHFDLLKGWIAGAYYSSEAGMRELGWDGTLFFPSFPGCQHPGGHE